MTPSDLLLTRYRAARGRYNQGMDAHIAALGTPGEIGIDDSSSAFVDTPHYQQAREAQAEMVALEERYFRTLPRLVMAPCPICGQPLYRTFDPMGVDGFWWRGDAQPDEATPCPHFCVLLGAVALGEHAPQLAFDVHPGPGAPFVMPRLLAQPGMTAVISEIPMVDGATAYPIAYFAPRRPPVQTLTAGWARTTFVYTTQLGEHGWRRAEVPTGAADDTTWDFELAPWIERGQLRWCEPGSDRTGLSDGPPSAFPYRDHPGTRLPQRLPATP